ncbi:MAG: hypothetical protein HYY17_02175 [Planctomycetes bacterium]|nr:hypothetical protein [Planctomycetota bacterium]
MTDKDAPDAGPPPESTGPSAPALGPNRKMLAIAGGGVVAVVALVLLMVSCLTTKYTVPGVDPKLDEPKDAAISYIEFRWERRSVGESMDLKHAREDLSDAEDLARFYEDREAYLRENVAKEKTLLKFVEKNRSVLREKKINIDAVDGPDERKTVKYTIEYKSVRLKDPSKGESPDDYDLEDRKGTGVLTVARLGGKWRLVAAEGFLARGGRGE